MAGFFGLFDYTKEGPGVDANAPSSPPIVVFFQVFFRKFWKLIQANLLFALFNIPALAAMLVAVMFLFPEQISDDIVYDFIFRLSIGFILAIIPVITVGPAQAGFTYILRNYSREEHAFIWYDFKENARKNLKQSLLISIIDFVVVLLFGFVINFYLRYPDGNSLTAIAAGIAIVAFLFFLMMHIYIYPMLVTFQLSLKNIFKNAFIFSIVGLLPNLLIIVVCVALVFATFLFSIYIGVFLYIFITCSLIGLILNSFAWPKLKKYIADKIGQVDTQQSDTQQSDTQREDNQQADVRREETSTEGHSAD